MTYRTLAHTLVRPIELDGWPTIEWYDGYYCPVYWL